MKKESDWELYKRIVDECFNAERNHNLRQDLIQKDIAKRFAKAVRQSCKKGDHGA